MNIDSVKTAKLLIALDNIAKELGLEAVSGRYDEELRKLTDEVIEKLEVIWAIEEDK